jgi:hypothetical protein
MVPSYKTSIPISGMEIYEDKARSLLYTSELEGRSREQKSLIRIISIMIRNAMAMFKKYDDNSNLSTPSMEPIQSRDWQC